MELVRSRDFEITAAAYADSLRFFACLICKWFGSERGRLSTRCVRFHGRIVFPVSRVIDRAGLSGSLGGNLAIIAERSDPPAQAGSASAPG